MGETAKNRTNLTDVAAEWLVALDAGSVDEEKFEAWRNADPRHASAFAQVAATWAYTADKRTAAFYEDCGGGTAAHAEADMPAAVDAGQGRGATRRQMMGGIAAGIIATAGAGAFLAWPKRAVASTGVGERRDLVLPDGSRAMLNTDSQIAWRFHGIRELWLDRGEVLLSLRGEAKDGVRLYSKSFNARLQPGKYDARLAGDSASFLTVQGAAQVDAGGAKPQSVLSGQLLTVDVASVQISDAGAADMADALAWQRGEIVFNGMALGQALDEFNRYLGTKLVLTDPVLKQTRLGGRFELDDPQRFLAALDQGFGIAHRRTDKGIELYRAGVGAR
ncbi:FecR family protein [Novosphingobium sp. MBES04]|uniref:FecR family protein n=1 Tax=Novosphingobium sp. MBES04 TaxID=1206458 RepID=UPI000A01909D|nr:DUF4880 domain-containing protein [Novosphingobium sp. MBES04]